MSRIGTRRALLYRPPAAASAGWWDITGQTCVAAYQPKGAADLAASYVNLANPGTGNAAEVVAPLFNTATGWQIRSLASGGGHLTGPELGDAYTMLVRMSSPSGVNATLLSANNWIGLRNSSGLFGYTYRGTAATRSSMASATSGLAAGQAYRDGSTDGAVITGASAVSGAINIGGTTWPMGCYIQALVIYSTTLSASDVAALTTAMNAL